jgi:formamidopyrimidine-DNA glycosylase
MPELPEVETIVRALRDGGRGGGSLKGRVVSGAELFWEKTLSSPAFPEFIKRITSQMVTDIKRRGWKRIPNPISFHMTVSP